MCCAPPPTDPPPPPTLPHALTTSLPHTASHTFTLSHCHSLTLPPTLSPSHTVTRSHCHSLTLPPTLSPSHPSEPPGSRRWPCSLQTCCASPRPCSRTQQHWQMQHAAGRCSEAGEAWVGWLVGWLVQLPGPQHQSSSDSEIVFMSFPVLPYLTLAVADLSGSNGTVARCCCVWLGRSLLSKGACNNMLNTVA
jgi:hypothetical protein